MVYLKNWWLLGATLFAVASIVAAACVGADGDEIIAPEPTVAEDIPSGEEVHANAESEPESKPERAPAPPQAMGDPERGRALYSANTCAFCHGENGQGGIGPKISRTRLTLDEVIEQYRNPQDAMPAFSSGTIPDGAVADIYAWLQSIG